MIPRILIVAAAVLFIGLAPNRAEACSCVGTYSGGPACQARWQYTQVFRGKVTGIAKVFSEPKDVLEANAKRITFDVLEAFAGVNSRTYELADAGSSCSVPFRIGEEYLVYVLNGRVTLCSPTRRIEEASDDLKYLRAVPAAVSPREGRIAGIVIHEQYEDPAFGRRPFAGARIVVEGQGVRRMATTGSDGRFELRVPAGKYRVQAQVDERLYASAMALGETELRDTRGCAVADFQVQFNGHVAARVLTHDGRPVPFLGVTLATENGQVGTSQTDAQGLLRFDRVAPGRYLLKFEVPDPESETRSVTWFLPGTRDRSSARVAAVGPSQLVDFGDFVIPDTLRFVTVSGIVQDPFGNLVDGSNVSVARATGSGSTEWTARTKADGRFSLALPESHEYRLTAYMAGGARADVTIRAKADMPPIVLVPVKK